MFRGCLKQLNALITKPARRAMEDSGLDHGLWARQHHVAASSLSNYLHDYSPMPAAVLAKLVIDTGDFTPLEVMADYCSRRVGREGVDAAQVWEWVRKCQREELEATHAVMAALENDGHISEDELRDCEREILEAMAALRGLLAVARQESQARRPEPRTLAEAENGERN